MCSDEIMSDREELETRDREPSIYDIPNDSPTFGLSNRLKERTDSESNLLWTEEEPVGANQPLILDVTEDHFGLPEDLTRLRGLL